MKKLLCFLSILFLMSCIHRDPIIIENGPLSEAALNLVPYIDGEQYQLRHSAGQLITFQASRVTQDELTFCEWNCKYRYHYEINTTKLVPDYPIFSFTFVLANWDSTFVDFSANAGKYGFWIPTNDYQSQNINQLDSIVIDSRTYYDVLTLKSDRSDDDSIFVDSLYYNYEYGVLKVLMSNEENYTIVP